MDDFTQRQIAVLACRHEDFLRLAEQERLAAYAIATRRRARASSHATSDGIVLGFIQGLVTRLLSLRLTQVPRTAAWRGNVGRSPVA